MDEQTFKARVNQIDTTLETLLAKGSANDDVLSIMKELLAVTKIKNKMSDYLDD